MIEYEKTISDFARYLDKMGRTNVSHRLTSWWRNGRQIGQMQARRFILDSRKCPFNFTQLDAVIGQDVTLSVIAPL